MARDVIRKYWYAPRCERAGQTSGDVSADVVRALPKSHVEVKYLKSIAAFRFHGQALRDAEQDELPLVMMRETGLILGCSCSMLGVRKTSSRGSSARCS